MLIKLTKKCGDETVEKLNQVLVDEARDKKIALGRKLRCNTRQKAVCTHPCQITFAIILAYLDVSVKEDIWGKTTAVSL